MSEKYSTDELVRFIAESEIDITDDRLRGLSENIVCFAIIARLRAADRLCETMKKTANWYKLLIAKCERDEKRYRGTFNSLADAELHDAKNYKIQLEEACKAIAEYEGEQDVKEK